MKIQVLYFAVLKERVGLPHETLEVPEGTGTQDLLEILAERHEVFRGLTGFRLALNQEFLNQPKLLADGDEVAVIPPVSGGQAPRLFVALGRDPISSDALTEAVAHPSAGAITSFLGVVRDQHQGKAVRHLEYEAYEAMAEKELRRVGEELLAKFPEVLRLALVHRFGDLAIGEASVGVAVATAHRRLSFEVCQAGIDTVKERVPIWKREHYESGEIAWVRADEMGYREGETGFDPTSSSD